VTSRAHRPATGNPASRSSDHASLRISSRRIPAVWNGQSAQRHQARPRLRRIAELDSSEQAVGTLPGAPRNPHKSGPSGVISAAYLVIASFEYHRGLYGLRQPHIHNVAILALTQPCLAGASDESDRGRTPPGSEHR
jgi:hypothetical protein